jgi:hypothetical protein
MFHQRALGTFMRTFLIALGLAASLMAAEFPQADIANGMVRAKLYLPATQDGYYRATRFDWSGVIASLEYKGHSYFGVWFPRYDPKLHDSITGPVESFSALWFDDAKPGDTFVRIGVGVLRRPDERKVNDFFTYDIVDPGTWTNKIHADSVESTQTLPGVYVYRKTVRLEKGKPVLVLEHSLRNTGKKVIETDVFNHDFYMLDGKPTGPDVTVTFPFDVKVDLSSPSLAEMRGKQLVYLKELEPRQSVSGWMTGFGDTAADYDFRIENRKTGAGVRQTGDHPLSKINYWSIRTTACPEGYNHLRVEPGKEIRWRISYEFYEVK